MTPADRYDRVAGAFGARVRAVDPRGWQRPTPCQGWLACDVVAHLTSWVPAFLASQAGVPAPDLPDATTDPPGAWAALDAHLRSVLGDAATAGRTLDGPMGATTVAGVIDQIVTPDVLVHTWDLARATGLDDALDGDEVLHMVAAMEPFDAQLRASGHYGSRVAVDPAAPAQDRLLAFLGRDPAWSPPGS